MVWDTPDFDSLSAQKYQRGVLEAAALADTYLLVLSREKYSDLSVWRTLRLLEPLGRPLVIALNKVTPDCAGVLARSLRQRLEEFGPGWGDVPICPVEYCPELAVGQSGELPAVFVHSSVTPLLKAVVERLEAGRGRPDSGVCALVKRHWESWVAPLRAEHAALADWDQHLDAGLQRFVERYRRDYLDHPHRYDAFRRAALELLHLLEIPKFSGWVGQARRLATWPLRQLWSLRHAGRSSPGRVAGAPRHQTAELAVLFDALEELLTGLQRDVSRRCDPTAPGFAIWRAIGERLAAEETRLQSTFHAALDAHHAEVTREIHAAANDLYEQLRQQPLRLAALRAARTAIDVGALALAVKTGGLSAVDLLWAPASFALSSMLVEGFAGVQMAAVAGGLKRRQQEAVETNLVQRVLTRELGALAIGLNDAGVLGIPTERLTTAEAALRAWEQPDDA